MKTFLLKTAILFSSIVIALVVMPGCEEKSLTKEHQLYTVDAPSQLIVRDQPSANGKKITSLPHKSQVRIDTIIDGWGRVADIELNGYVNMSYVTKSTLDVASSRDTVHEESLKYSAESLFSSNKGFKDFCYHNMPYAILILLIIGCICLANENVLLMNVSLVLLSLSEMLYLCCNSGYGSDFWFVDEHKVGWIMVIVDYLLVLGLAVGQALMVFASSGYYMSGWANGISTWILSPFAGIFIMASILSMHFDLIPFLLGIGAFMTLIAVTYFSVRQLPLAIGVSILDMFVITTFLAFVLSMSMIIFAGLLIFIGICIFGNPESVSGKSGQQCVEIENEYGEKVTLMLEKNTPYMGYDSANSRWYEKKSDGYWYRSY